MSTLKVLWQMPETKKQVQTFVLSIKDEILNSGSDALRILKQLKMVEKTLAEVLSDDEINKHLVNQAENNYNSDELENLFGAKFQIREVGVKYDYSKCDDLTLDQLEKQKKELDKKIKERQGLLKSIKPLTTVFDESTGVELKAPSKSSKTKLVVTL